MLLKKFKVKPGVTNHTHDGQVAVPGDEIQLTPSQAKAFADRFEAVDPDAEFEEVDPKDYKPYQPSKPVSDPAPEPVSAQKPIQTQPAPPPEPPPEQAAAAPKAAAPRSAPTTTTAKA